MEATQVEVVELSSVSDVDCAGESGKNHCMVDHQLGGETGSPSFPHVLSLPKATLALVTCCLPPRQPHPTPYPRERVLSR